MKNYHCKKCATHTHTHTLKVVQDHQHLVVQVGVIISGQI